MPEFTSPSKKYSGTIVLPDWYDWGRIMAYDAALDRANVEGLPTLEVFKAQADAILPMVDEWHITGLPAKPTSLPAVPVNAAVALNRFLLNSISSIINQPDDDTPFLSEGSGGG